MMRRLVAFVFLVLVTLALIAAAATHVLILLPGDTGIIQCPGGVLTLLGSDTNQVSAVCGDAPTVTATPTTTSTETPAATETATSISTATRTITPSATPTASQTHTATSTPTITATPTATASHTATPTPTATATRTATPTPSLTFLPLVMRLAIVGDSVQDEYRADSNRGAPYYSTTFNPIELMQRLRGVDFGAWGTRAEPRRSGYEYNWARSGADTDAAIYNQLPGVLAQLNSGAATHAIIHLGLNDLNENGLISSIYYGTISGQPLTDALNHIADNISYLGRTANTAAPGRVLIATTQDYFTTALLPETPSFPDPAGIARVNAALDYIDARTQAQAAIDGVLYWDYNAALAAELAPRRSGNVITVGGQSILISPRSNEYHHAWLNEPPYTHAGTALSGLIANVYIDVLNTKFGLSIPRLTDAEIIAAAGG